MSKTLIDMPKVAQALDAGYRMVLYKNEMGSYTVEAFGSEKQMQALQYAGMLDEDEYLVTDDFTPEQALTRAAYKCVDKKILGSEGEDE